MKKKIIFLVFCLILFLILTASSYGGPDPKYRFWARPDQELMLCAPDGDRFDDVLLLVIPNWNGFSLLVCVKKESPKENVTLQSLATQKVESKTNSDVKRAR